MEKVLFALILGLAIIVGAHLVASSAFNGSCMDNGLTAEACVAYYKTIND